MARKTILRAELDERARSSNIQKVIMEGSVHKRVGKDGPWALEGRPTRHQKRHLHHVIDQPAQG